ncbi:MAG: lectin-like protein [Ferruginibacter sp.]
MKQFFSLLLCCAMIFTAVESLAQITPSIQFSNGNVTLTNEPGICGRKFFYFPPNFIYTCFNDEWQHPYIGDFNGYRYFTDNGFEFTWAQANAMAHAWGVELVSIGSAAENDFLRSHMDPYYKYWIGLSDTATEGTFKWTDGTPFTYSNWASGEPNNANDEDYVVMTSNGKWNDVNSDTRARFFVKTTAGVCNLQAQLIAGLPSNSIFPVGVTTVTYQGTDYFGTTVQNSFTVTVEDHEGPVFVPAPQTSVVNIPAGSCNGLFQYTMVPPAVTDNCSVQSVVSDHPSDMFPIGYTPVKWTATDIYGNTNFRIDTVLVRESIPPQVSNCPMPVTVNSLPGQCGALANFNIPDFADNCNDITQVKAKFDAIGKVQTFKVPAGVSSIRIEATGGAGGSMNSYLGGRGAYMSGDFTVTPGETLYLVVGQKGVDANLTYSGGNGGGGSFVTRDPQFHNQLLIAAGAGGGGGYTDNYEISVLQDATITTNGNSGYGFSAGAGGINGNGGNIITYMYGGGGGAGAGWLTNGGSSFDLSNNRSWNNGGKSPANGATGGEATYGNGGAYGGGGSGESGGGGGGGGYSGGGAAYYGYLGGGGGSFNSGTNQTNLAGINTAGGHVIITYSGSYPVITQTAGLPSGSVFPTGVTVNTWVAEDGSGNKTSCSNKVTVLDIEAPQIQPIQDIAVNVDPGQCTAVVNYNTIITDNCGHVSPVVPSTYTYLGEFQGHRYYLSSSQAFWKDAKDSAAAIGGTLVCINSLQENNFLNNALPQWGYGWAGGFQDPYGLGYAEPDQGWQWQDGTALGFTNWIPGSFTYDPEVSNSLLFLQGDNGATFPGGFYDYSGSFPAPWIVEVAPVIKTILVTGLASGSAFPVGTTPVSISVADSSGNVGNTISFNVIVDGTPAQPASISGPTNVCPYINSGTTVTYSVPSTLNATGFQWTVPPTVSIISGQGTNSITVSIGSGFAANANKQIRVKGTNACGTGGTEKIFYLLAQSPTTATAIQSSSNDICTAIGSGTPATFTIPKVPAATAYIWTAQNGTTTITHTNGAGVNDTTISIIFSSGFTTSTVTVQAINDCGAGGVRSFTVTRNNPATPSLINGPTNVCANIGATGVAAIYSVAASAGTTYNWNVPPAAIGLTGQGTNSISFNYPAGFTSGNISVTATNGCGSGPARTLAVTKLNPATPSVIDVIQTGSCPNRTYSYTLVAMPANSTSVQWTIPAGATLVSGQGTSSITVGYTDAALQGSVTATAINNCGTSTARSTQVKIPACPPPAFSKGKNENSNIIKQVSIQTNEEKNLIVIAPNPSTTSFNLTVNSISKQPICAILFDATGKQIKKMKITANEKISFGNELKAGIYMLEIQLGNERRTERLVKL